MSKIGSHIRYSRIDLNKRDLDILRWCSLEPLTINHLARLMGVDPSSVHRRVHKLEAKGKIIVERLGKGKKTIVRTKGSEKVSYYLIKVLNKVKKDGFVTRKDVRDIVYDGLNFVLFEKEYLSVGRHDRDTAFKILTEGGLLNLSLSNSGSNYLKRLESKKRKKGTSS